MRGQHFRHTLLQFVMIANSGRIEVSQRYRVFQVVEKQS